MVIPPSPSLPPGSMVAEREQYYRPRVPARYSPVPAGGGRGRVWRGVETLLNDTLRRPAPGRQGGGAGRELCWQGCVAG